MILLLLCAGQDRLHRWRGLPAAEDSLPRYHPDRPLRSSRSSGAPPRAEIPAPPLLPTRPPRRLRQLIVSSTVARRCVSGMVKPGPGGHMTPWKRVASSSSSASSTGRCAPPSPLHTLATPPCRARHMTPIARHRSAPLDCSCPCAKDFLHVRRDLGTKAPPCFCFMLWRPNSREQARAVRPSV